MAIDFIAEDSQTKVDFQPEPIDFIPESDEEILSRPAVPAYISDRGERPDSGPAILRSDLSAWQRFRNSEIGHRLFGPTELEQSVREPDSQLGPAGGVGLLQLPQTAMQFSTVPPQLAEPIRRGVDAVLANADQSPRFRGLVKGGSELLLNFPLAPVPLFPKTVLAAFGTEYVFHLPEAKAAYYEALDRGDLEEATKIAVQEVGGGALLAFGAAHTAMSELPSAKPVEARAAEVGPATAAAVEQLPKTPEVSNASEITKTEELLQPLPASTVESQIEVPASAAPERVSGSEPTQELAPSSPGTTPEEVGSIGPGAASPEDFAPVRQFETSIKNERIDQERKDRGLDPLMAPLRRSFGEVWDKAMAIINDDAEAPARLVKELLYKPRALTDEEDALLLHRRVDLQNTFDRTSAEILNASEQGHLEQAAELHIEAARLSDALIDLEEASRAAGTESGRGLNARKMMAAEDFSLAKMITEKRIAKDGRTLTREEETEVKRVHDAIARTQKSIDEYMRRIAESDYAPKKRKGEILDPELNRLRAENERWKQAFRAGVLKDRLEGRTRLEKMQDTFIKWRRGFLLSSPVTLAKLTSAAVQRMTITPVEEAIGAGISRLLPKVAERAPREGGINARAEAKALTDSFTKGMGDAWQTLRTGKSELDLLYGRPDIMPREAIDFFGNLHGALKSQTKRNEFARSFEKRASSAIEIGEDVSDPLVQTRLAKEAYQDAQRSIFLQDNRVVAAYRRALTALEEKNAKTGQASAGGKALATVAKTVLPIVKVPTNIVAETLQYALGSVSGSARLARAMMRGVETLKPEEADLIMRHLKKGSLGAAVMLLGFLNPDLIGGYYQPGEKRSTGDVKAGRIKLGDWQVPSFLIHNPLLETLQIGATIRRVADSKLRRKDADSQGIGNGALAATLGLADEVPFVREMLDLSKLANPHERDQYLGEQAKSILIPQAVQFTAQQLDKNAYGDVARRKPGSLVEHLEAGLPGLRENVPLNRKQ